MSGAVVGVSQGRNRETASCPVQHKEERRADGKPTGPNVSKAALHSFYANVLAVAEPGKRLALVCLPEPVSGEAGAVMRYHLV